ncbi:MAG: AraC family transcriptional regulator [Bacteroidota bacterium]
MPALYRKVGFFDNLAILRADGYRQDFPLHRHDVFSLTLTRSGTETTIVNGRELLAPVGSISLTPPGCLHANPNRNAGTYDFTTFYLSPDWLVYLNEGTPFLPAPTVLQQPKLFAALLQWAEEAGTPETLAEVLRNSIVIPLRQTKGVVTKASVNDQLTTVLAYLEAHLADKILLEDLAKVAGLSPHHFLRWFRALKGITPLQYVNLRRIECAQQALAEGTPLIEVAHSLGFYDQSHFHRFFRRYAGVTPGTFLRGSNIVQDSDLEVA